MNAIKPVAATSVALILLCSLLLLSCDGDSTHNHHNQVTQEFHEGTQSMVSDMEAIYSKLDFEKNNFQNHEALIIMEKKIDEGDFPNTRKNLMKYANLLLRAGENDKAIDVINGLLMANPGMERINDSTLKIHQLLAITYMRKGEIDNCIINHNSESCLFPIKGEAIHTAQDGSRGAIQIYEQILEKFPEDYESMWLLNVAYMTLGEYPDLVPSQYLIKPDMIEDKVKVKSYDNMAMDLGLDINDVSGSSILDDMDNDGDLDLFASSWSLKGQLRYFENIEGEFVERTLEAGLVGLYGGLNLKQTDYNNDGYLDIYVIRGAWRKNTQKGIYPNSLLKNNGDGTFTDVTTQAGLYEITATSSVVWIDLNNNGWLDLFVANESRLKQKSDKFPCKLYINNGDGTFVERAEEYKLDLVGYYKGVATADYDNDGDQDLYVTNYVGENVMIKNLLMENDSLSFSFETSQSNTQEPLLAFPCWFFDYDNDGWEDLYVSAFADFLSDGRSAEVAKSYLGLDKGCDGPRLYHNNKNGGYTNVTKEMGLDLALHTMGCNYGDVNNDGYLDFYLGTGAPSFKTIVPNRLFLNQQATSFVDVTTSANVGNIQKGHGISIADIDNDGDQDIYAVMGGAFSGDNFQNALFINPGNDNASVKVKLVGTVTNKAALGSKIKLTVTENGKQRTIFRTVSSGASFGANSLTQEIGIGNSQSIDELEVRWANGSTDFVNYGSQPIDKRIIVTEGRLKVIVEDVNILTLSGDSKHNHHHHL